MISLHLTRFLVGAVSIHIALSPVIAAEANPERGKQVFTACAPCHASDQPAKTGPDLRGVYRRKAGALPGFRYSRAMKNSKITWNEATLDAYLADPQTALPGNAMPYPGLPDKKQRRDLIAYLKTLQ